MAVRLLALLAIAGLGALFFAFNPALYPFPRCPLFFLTGLHCPGCGSQRALHALLHGRVAQAAGLNLLAVLSLPVLAVGAADGALSWATGQPRRAALLYKPWLGWLVVAGTAGFAVARNLPGPVGGWLAP